jgi:hypothetical protein
VPEINHRRFLPMALIKCPECGNMVSDQAVACPQCGYPVRKVEYKFVTVSYSIHTGHESGKEAYEALLKEGWQVADERGEELTNDFGEYYGWSRHYKLQR